MNLVKKILNTFSGQDDGILVRKAYKGIRQVQEPACTYVLLLNSWSCMCLPHAKVMRLKPRFASASPVKQQHLAAVHDV